MKSVYQDCNSSIFNKLQPFRSNIEKLMYKSAKLKIRADVRENISYPCGDVGFIIKSTIGQHILYWCLDENESNE